MEHHHHHHHHHPPHQPPVCTFVPLPWFAPERIHPEQSACPEDAPTTCSQTAHLPVATYATVCRIPLLPTHPTQPQPGSIPPVAHAEPSEAAHIGHIGHRWGEHLRRMRQKVREQERLLRCAKQVNASLHAHVLQRHRHRTDIAHLSLAKLCMDK